MYLFQEPNPVTGLAVDAPGTTHEVIKLTWSNPNPTPSVMKVLFNAYEMVVSDTTVEEFLIDKSTASTPLTAEESGTCKVVTAPGVGTPCASSSNEVFVPCQTKKASNGLVFHS